MTKVNRWLICILIVLIPITSYAMKPLEKGKVVITMPHGRPCFSYPQDKELLEKKTFAFSYLDVSDFRHKGGWEVGLSEPSRKGLMDPNKPATCVEYGIPNPGMKTTRTAEPLHYDVPYKVRMDVLTLFEQEGHNEYNYASDFCLTRDAKGETILVNAEWDDGAGSMKCLKPGEKAKRSFWQRLFGK